MLQNIIAEQQGFSTSLNNSFTILSTSFSNKKQINLKQRLQSIQKQKQYAKQPQQQKKQVAQKIQPEYNPNFKDINHFLQPAKCLYTDYKLYRNDSYEKQYQYILQIRDIVAKYSIFSFQGRDVDCQSDEGEMRNFVGDKGQIRKLMEDRNRSLQQIYYNGQNQEINNGKKISNQNNVARKYCIQDLRTGQNFIKTSNKAKARSYAINLLESTRNSYKQKINKNLPTSKHIISNFECGNLHSIYQSTQLPNTYFLILKNDTNTNGYTQWFNFYLKIPNKELLEKEKKTNNSYSRFIILNISKKIIYRKGMKILTKQQKSLKNEKQKWKRQIQFDYYQSKQGKYGGENYMIIDFMINADKISHGMYVALNYPYQYSRVNCLFKDIHSVCINQQIYGNNNISKNVEIQKIGQSALGMPILALQITNKSKIMKCKKKIIILARQHSSETVGSYICQYLIKQLILCLLSECKSEQHLRSRSKINENIQWFFVPMINPDGVIHGNSRTNIQGYDINRCWSKHKLGLSCEAESVNRYIKNLDVQPDDIIIDLHGHSRDLGVFTFCSQKNQSLKNFNQLMSQICPYFKLQKCTYGIESSKKETLRGQIYQRFSLKNCITIETSMYGYQYCKQQQSHLIPFEDKDFKCIAQSIKKCIDYWMLMQFSAKDNEVFLQGEKEDLDDSRRILNNIQAKLSINEATEREQQKDYGNQNSEGNKDDNEDSDSNPEGQYLLQFQRKRIQSIPDRTYYANTKKRRENQQFSAPKFKRQKIITQISNTKVQKNQKLNIINLSDLNHTYNQTNFERKQIQFQKYRNKLLIKKTRPLSMQNLMYSDNDLYEKLLKKKEANTKNVTVGDLESNKKINQISIVNNGQNYHARKKFKSLFHTSSQRNFYLVNKQSRNRQSRNLKSPQNKLFQDNHIIDQFHDQKLQSQGNVDKECPNSHTQNMVKAFQRTIVPQKRNVEQKTVAMKVFSAPTAKLYSNNDKTNNQHLISSKFMQNTENINWKLRTKIQVPKQKLQKQSNNNLIIQSKLKALSICSKKIDKLTVMNQKAK